MSSVEERLFSRKVFFLYPHSVIKDELMDELTFNEYEAYTIKAHQPIIKILRKYNNAIIFINIDEVLAEEDWEVEIKKIMADPSLSDIKIGIVTYNEDLELAQKYLMDIMVPAGFIRLKQGYEEAKKILLKTLEVNEAKGRRKYVRAKCEGSKQAIFNIRAQGAQHAGKIIDISSVGMAVRFDDHFKLELRKVIPDIQLRLKGSIIMVTGISIGYQRDNSDVYVILFDKNLKKEVRDKIRHFVYSYLQDEMNKLVEKLL